MSGSSIPNLNKNEINSGNGKRMSTRSRARSGSAPRSRQDGVRERTRRPFARADPGVFMVRDPNTIKSGFTLCLEPGCMTSTRVASYPSMTMRTGLSYCTDHVRTDEISIKSKNKNQISRMTLIFYDIELSNDGEIEQIGARSESGHSFSAMIKTPVRNNTSPVLRSIPPRFWNLCASEPKDAITNFISWTHMIHGREKGNDESSNIMLAAHFGSCHDHVYLFKTMMRWGITPPKYMLVDTLAIFKVMKGMNKNAKLKTLANEYASWIEHIPHDANSDADVLRFVTMFAFPKTTTACFSFGIPFEEFASRTGLNLYVPSPIAVFAYSPTHREVIRRPSSSLSENSVVTASSI